MLSQGTDARTLCLARDGIRRKSGADDAAKDGSL